MSITAKIAKPFTENWLQALTLSVGSPTARQVKPLISDIDTISQTGEIDLQLAASTRVWNFAQEHRLIPLLKLLPMQQIDWMFPGEDSFVFQAALDSTISTSERWQEHLGLKPSSFALNATITATDWGDLLRREAVRQRRTVSSLAMQATSTVETSATATWDGQRWTIDFSDADWVHLSYEEPFECSRPSSDSVEEVIITALMDTEQKLPKALPASSTASTEPWRDVVTPLTALHDTMISKRSSLHPWLQRVWCAVWPVVYREQNQLNGKCDLDWLRKELAECFQYVPATTLWMFVAAKLICSSQLGRGLGIAGNFRRT